MDLLQIAAYITAITTILGGGIKIFNVMSKTLHRFDDLNNRLDKIENDIKKNEIHLLKIALLDENLPLTDRINAGKQYLELGGNGFGKITYERLVKELETMYSKGGEK